MVVSNYKSSATIFSTPSTSRQKDEKEIVLKDGTAVLLRPLKRSDWNELRALFESFSNETLYFRYFTCSPQYIERELERISKALDKHELIIVAELLETENHLLGICELSRQERTPNVAECAVTVTDEWQGKSLGVQMLEWLVKVGGEQGINCIIGYFNAGNFAVSALIRKSGFKYRTTCNLNCISFQLFLDEK